ncbi:hypothetical protein KUL42_39580 [Alteromonas sp. KUL42]|uniref:hypothetical protein n=1 Tax=Alteromonas sp. KUL42 TaxID=2480797 RepID=UPI001035D4E2|nr:hypothetical protein [Alteromonas sp. KUL42]TAP31760.1 hypothetical protein EYR97_19935 [Alteromonas sp. KUL42]GEA09197.1 hypothetical protein KUL42_39580 [Alteromonas sp. KUL42]
MAKSENSNEFIGLKSLGYINKISKLPNSDTEVAEITILSGKTQEGKNRYSNGSFIVTTSTRGVADISESLNTQTEERGILVKVSIKDYHGVISKCGKYINYRGLLDSVVLYEQ